METLQRTANRGSVSTGYDVANSVKFEGGLTEYLTRDVSSAGSRTKGTISLWTKKTENATAQYLFTFGNTDNDTGRTFARFQTDDTLRIGGGTSTWRNTNRVFRDTNAWYHFVIAFDTTQSTANDRFKLYVNGVQETSFSTTNNPSQNDNLGINFEKQVIGYNSVDNGQPYNGYMCEICYQDGTASAPTEFGEFDSNSGIWKPIDVASKPSGTNKFYLDFEDSSNLGNDVSGGTDFTENNIAAADQATDTCTNNFATFNQLHPKASGTNVANGNAQFYISSNYQTAVSSIAVSKGKWYAEFTCDSTTSFIGIVDVEDAYIPQNHTGYYLGYAGSNQNRSVGLRGSDGALLNRTGDFYGASYSASDIIGVGLNMDDRKINFSVNGTWMSSDNSGTPANGATWNTSSSLGDAWTDVITMGVTGYSNITWKCNFGGFTLISISSGNSDANGYGNFEYAVPSGFYALCSKNLAEYG